MDRDVLLSRDHNQRARSIAIALFHAIKVGNRTTSLPFSRWSVASRGLPPRLALSAPARPKGARRGAVEAAAAAGLGVASALRQPVPVDTTLLTFPAPLPLAALRRPGRAQAPPAAPRGAAGQAAQASPGRARDGDELALPHKAGDEASRPSRRRSRRARCEASGGAQGKSCCLLQRETGRHLEA